MRFSKRQLVVAISILFIVLASFFIFSKQKELADIPFDVGTKAYRDFWINRVSSVGAHDAYEEFKHINALSDAGSQHLASHVIGNVLYEKEGANGVTVCDASFGFGCFHGFFGVALASEGVSAIKELDEACVDRFGELGTGCTHGIGHGILEYYGHERIHDALAICDDTTQLVSILGCTSGVFMEYNTPLFETEDGGLVTLPREFDSLNAYGPCGSVSEKYKQSCYFELGSWWELSLGKDWEKMEALCSALSNTENFKFCMLGVGHTIGNRVNYEVSEIGDACDAMGRDQRLYCRAGAHWMLYSNPDYRESAPELCEVFDEPQQSVCLKEGRPDLWPQL